jgi:MOSC domain-containing protein YiiM
MKIRVLSLNTGVVETIGVGPREVASAFNKTPVEQAYLSKNGFEKDEQADLKHHGGLDKAVCVFSSHHFPAYEELLGKDMPIPAFGENLTVDLADEKELFIGDIFQCGIVKLQISQPRQPCSKPGLFHNNNGIIKFMANNGSTGFYFRVLTGGLLKQGDEMTRIESDRLFSLAYANDFMYRRNQNHEEMRTFLAHPSLSKAWKGELGARIK